MPSLLDVLDGLRSSGSMASSAQLRNLVGPPASTGLALSPQYRPQGGSMSSGDGCGGAGGRAQYSFGGRFTFTSTGANSVDTRSIDVTGASIPADSYLVMTSSVNGDSITEIACDDQPTPLGVGGGDLEAIDVANNRAQEQPLQLPATKNVRVTVKFNAASVAGNTVTLQLWRRGWAVTTGAYCATR
jgi:hypothetical protein